MPPALALCTTIERWFACFATTRLCLTCLYNPIYIYICIPYTYIYIYIVLYTHTHIYIYIYIFASSSSYWRGWDIYGYYTFKCMCMWQTNQPVVWIHLDFPSQGICPSFVPASFGLTKSKSFTKSHAGSSCFLSQSEFYIVLPAGKLT